MSITVTDITMGDIPTEKPRVIKAKGSLKVWSGRTQKYFYKSNDPQYYNNFVHANRKEMVCEICNRTVTCQMYSHLKSKRCIARKK